MIGITGFSGHLVAPSFIARECGTGDRELPKRWRAAAAAWAAARRELGPASSVRSMFDVLVAPFLEATALEAPRLFHATDRHLAASVHDDGGVVTVLVVPWAQRLDGFFRTAVAESQNRGARWCLVFNGPQLRIVDTSRLYGRRHVECDLPLVLDRIESFAGLFRIMGGRTLFAGATEAHSLHALVDESDRHAAGVCRSLRDGVLGASADVLRALLARDTRLGKQTVGDAFEQSLTIVYRIVFLLFAEARALVPTWHPVYRESYSVEALRDHSERGANRRGFWDALRAMSRLAHAGCQAGDLRVTPFNGRLFAPARTPMAERRGLDDEALRHAVLAVSTRRAADGSGRERIVYRELGVEQLGAVYETLLDYQPRVTVARSANRQRKVSVSLESGSGIRKATGSFYTPQPLADYLVRRALAPLVSQATPEAILALRVVDPAMGSGAFLVAACHHLAAAYENALIESGGHHPADFGEAERTSIRRLIAERCLYGVDLNPTAVQLARLSMWLTTLSSDRPLSFLDHRLLTGDSLLGAWLRCLRQPPGRIKQRRGSTSLPLFVDDSVAEAMTAALPVRFSFERTPNDTLEQVRNKERALASLAARSSALSRWKRVADLWCAIWFADSGDQLPSEAFRSLADDILSGTGALSSDMSRAYLDRAQTIADIRRFFHWELEFPEVFFDADGQTLSNPGFDAIIGNPPWDMMRADADAQQEPAPLARQRAEIARSVRFTRDSGIYKACRHGHANRYQLFVERAMALTRSGGRLGLVLPSGFAADHGSSALRGELMTRCDVDAIVGVDNVRGIFPIHRSVRFLLTTATTGRPTRELRCRFGIERVHELEAVAAEGVNTSDLPVALTPAAIERLSGRSMAIPHLRSVIDLQIAEKAAALFAPLGSPRGWAASFGRELNATDDRDLFRPGGSGWPVVEGKHLEPFRIAAKTSRSIAATDAKRLLATERIERARLAYRDVASATNRLTLISAILPARTVSTHTVFCLRSLMALRHQHTLCGLFNSLVVNYLVRLRVTTHVTTAIVEQLPIPSHHEAPSACREIAALARLLSRTWNAGAFARLNAIAARLYQLTPEEFEHVLSTFPLVTTEDRSLARRSFLEDRR